MLEVSATEVARISRLTPRLRTMTIRAMHECQVKSLTAAHNLPPTREALTDLIETIA